MLKPIGQDSENQHFNLGYSFFFGRAVAHRSRQSRNFGDPAAVGLLFDFDLHEGTLLAGR